MATWKYRIVELETTDGTVLYFPQFRHKWFPFWSHFCDYINEDRRLAFVNIEGAKRFLRETRAKDEPEVKRIRKIHSF